MRGWWEALAFRRIGRTLAPLFSLVRGILRVSGLRASAPGA